MFVDLSTVSLVWPEFMLILIATWMYLGGTVSRGRTLWTALAVITYLVVFAVVWKNEHVVTLEAAEGLVSVNGPLIIDYLGQMSRYGCLGVGLLLTLLAARAGSEHLATETLGTIMMLVAGLMLVSRANELVFLFVALELISIPTYVVLYLGRADRANSEATVKYFFLSMLASSLLVYGMSFLYGVGGGTTLLVGTAAVPGIREALAELPPHQMSLFTLGLVAVVSGLGFKMAAVPFHFYAPDVYQGTTNMNAGLLAVVPKIAGLLALIRLVVAIMPPDWSVGWQLLAVLAIASMTWGNVCALWQSDMRRLMAYSSMAHAGYMLIGLAVALAAWGSGGVSAALLYLAVYALAALGVFGALNYLGDSEREVRSVAELAGLARVHPWVAGVLAICLFSLAGLPPLAGFWGKLALFTGAISVALEQEPGVWVWFLVLGVVGVVNAAIGAAYYLRVISTMYFMAPAGRLPGDGGRGAAVATATCGVLVVLVGLLPGWALRTAASSDPLLQQSRMAIDVPPAVSTADPHAASRLDVPDPAPRDPWGAVQKGGP